MTRKAHNKITFIKNGTEIPMTPENRWKLIQEVLDPTSDTFVKEKPNYAQEYIENIEKKFPLLTVDLIREFAKQKRSGAELCREFKINPNAFVAFCKFHQTGCNFTQCDPKTKALLASKEKLETLIRNKNSEILAMELNVSPSLILQSLHKHGIEWDSYSGRSVIEIEVASYIKSIYAGKVETNTRKIIPPKEIDIFLPDVSIGIEINGIFFHSFKKTKHKEKRELCVENGIKLIQMTDYDWNTKKELIKKKINHILGASSERVFARRCSVSKTTNTDIRNFVDENHIYGHKNCQHCYKLEFDGEIVGVMTFTKNHLERFCTSKSVVGGFSKLFKFAVDNLGLIEVVTFADLSWSSTNDNVYIKNGFSFEKINNPNYWWIKGSLKLSRQKCQKHKLSGMQTYHPDKSETQIMQDAGFHKYYDAGHAKFKWVR